MLQWVDCAKHLGNHVSCDLRETEEIRRKKGDLIGRVNVIAGTLVGVSCELQLKVLRSQCHYYGSETWSLSDPNVKLLHTAVNKGVRRLMNLPYATHTRFLPVLSGLPSAKDSIANRFVKMYLTMLQSSNDHVSFVARRGRVCAHSIIGSNLRMLSRDYSVPIDSLGLVRLRSPCNIQDMSTVQAIRDCLNGQLPDFFTEAENKELFINLCEH